MNQLAKLQAALDANAQQIAMRDKLIDAALHFIAASPGDPDIFPAQSATWAVLIDTLHESYAAGVCTFQIEMYCPEHYYTSG